MRGEEARDGVISDGAFRQVAERLSVPCWLTDAAGTMVWCNASWSRRFGLSATEAQGRRWDLACGLDPEAEALAPWRQAFEVGHPFVATLTHPRLNGRAHKIELRLEPLAAADRASLGITNDAADERAFWMGTCLDGSGASGPDLHHAFLLALGDQLRGEADPHAILVKTAQALGTHLGVHRVGYGEIDSTGRYITVEHDWTDGLASSVGTYPLSVFGDSIVHESEAGATFVSTDVLADPRIGPGDWPGYEALAIRAVLSVPLVKDGRLRAVLSVQTSEPRIWRDEEARLAQDVAERTWSDLDRARAEVALRDSEAQFRSLANNMPQLAWTADPAGNLLWFNDRWYKYTGLTPKAAAGTGWHQVHAPEELAAVLAWAEETLASGVPSEVVFQLRGADGRYRPFLTAVQPILDDHGHVSRWLGTNTDLSETLDAERDQALVLKISDQLRRSSDPTEVLTTLTERLGRHLGVNRVGFSVVAESGDTIQSAWEWADDVIGRSENTSDLEAFGPHNVAAAVRGETLCFEDISSDPRTQPPYQDAFTRQGTAAQLVVPLVGPEGLRALLYVEHAKPRAFSPRQIELVQDIAQRTWSTLERARAEARLRESEALLSAFMQNAPIGMYVKDADGRYLLANPEMEKVIGQPLSEIIGRTAADLSGPDFARRIAEHDRALLDSGRSHSFEQHLPGQSTYEWSLVLRFPIALGADAPARIGGFDIDVSEQKRVQERLEASERRYRSMVELQTEFVVRMSPDGRLSFVNDAYCRATGLSREALLSPSWCEFDVLPRPERERFLDHLARLTPSAPDAFIELRNHLPDGRSQVLAWNDHGLFNAEGRLVEVQSVGRDVTERVEAEAARRRAEAELARSREAFYQSEKLAALGSLLAGVSHELNNPLAAISIQTTILEDLAQGTPLAERAAKVRRAAERSARIVQTFLAMARQKQPERRLVSVNDLVRVAFDLTDYSLRTAGIEVTCDISPDLPLLLADPDQLHQVLVNLLVNAGQALQDHAGPRRLTVRARQTEGAVVLDVIDNGPGIRPELRRRIFEPFFTTKPQGAGTGVGLSFSQGLVEAHGGRLELVEADQAGRTGTCFRVTLPVVTVATTAPTSAEAPSASPGHGGERALIVDDEADLADGLAATLARQGYGVDVATTGHEAQALIAANRYDVILSDLKMPDLDGPTLFRWIKAEHPRLVERVTFMTGDTMGAAAARFLAEAGRPYLEKPFTPETLRRLVDELSGPADRATEPTKGI